MFKQAKAGLLLSSAAYLILGVCLIGWPDLSVSLLCQGFGAVVLISGLVQVWRYLRREGNPFYAYLSLLYGVVAAALGVALIAWPKLFLSVLPVVFGLFLIVDSIGRLGQALDLKAVGYGRWWVYLLTSLVSIALGAFVLCNPFQTDGTGRDSGAGSRDESGGYPVRQRNRVAAGPRHGKGGGRGPRAGGSRRECPGRRQGRGVLPRRRRPRGGCRRPPRGG